MTVSQNIIRIEDLSFDDEFIKSLVRLPYRIGFWLSQSDQTGGDQSDELEQAALESVILSYGEDVCKSEFTQSVMEQTVAQYDDWEKWVENIENVPRECESIIYHLSSEISPKALNDFKASLFEIAETVALAYRELEDKETNFLDNLYTQIRITQKKWDAFMKRYEFSLDHVLNISPSEEAALRTLKGALRI